MIRAILVLCLLANTLFAQPPASPEQLPNLGQAIGQGAEVAKLKERIAELEAELNPTTNDFAYPGDDLFEHIKRDHRALKALAALHERLHQSIERLRPAGENSFIVFEGSDEQYNAWPEKDISDKWTVVRRPGALGWVVAIGKTHWSEAGYLTKGKLTQLVNQSRPSRYKGKTPQQVKVTKLTVGVRPIGGQTCKFCDQWKAKEAPQVIAEGVEIEYVDDTTSSVPWFQVCLSNGTCLNRHFGYMSWQALKQLR